MNASKIKKLVFVGNGFDLHFNLPTTYNDFENFVNTHFPNIKRGIETLFCGDMDNEKTLWNDFENHLALINKEEFTVSRSDVEGMKAVYGDIINLPHELRTLFCSWIKSISCQIQSTAYHQVTPGTFIISFNYTRTIEENFNIDPSHIYYIHGTSSDNIIFGHQQGVSFPGYKTAPYDMDLEDDEQFNECDYVTTKWLNDYLKATEKPVDQIIKKSEGLLQSTYSVNFSDIEEVYIIGHSFSIIDKPYFEWIARKTNAKWKLGYHECDCTARKFAGELACNDVVLASNKILIGEILE